MKVRVWVEHEVEVEINAGDAVASICDLDASERLPMALHGISYCAGFLKQVPDALIGEMNDKQREIIAEVLKEQVARYKTPNSKIDI